MLFFKFIKKHWQNILRFVISAGLLIYLFVAQIDAEQLWDDFLNAHYIYLITGFALMIVGTGLRGIRWKIILEAHNLVVSLRALIHLYFVGTFFNIFLPSGIGGDAVKIAELSKITGKTPESIGVTVVDRGIGIWILFLLALVALPFGIHLLPNYKLPIILLIVTGVIAGFLIMWTPAISKIGNKFRLPAQESLERLYQTVSHTGYPALLKASAVSLIFDGLLVVFIYFLALAFSVELQFYFFLVFAPLISVSEAIPISIGGLGLREFAYVLLFGSVGIVQETAIAMSFFHYILAHVCVGIIGGILYAGQGVRGYFLKNSTNDPDSIGEN